MNARLEEGRDRADVRRVHLDAFGEHGEVVANLVDDLRTGDELSLVAEEEGAIVGHAMFTPSLLDTPRRLVAVEVLSPVGVVHRRQKLGVGSALVRRGLEILAERGVPIVFVEGPPEYYSRFGFEPGAEQGFRKPSLRIPDKAFQALPLPAYEPWMTGTLVYSGTFWRHDAVGLRDGDGLGSSAVPPHGL